MSNSNNNQEEFCIICWENFQISDEIVVFSCLHKYHWTCISQWYNLSKTYGTCLNCNVERDITKIIVGHENLEQNSNNNTMNKHNNQNNQNIDIGVCCILM